MSGENTVEILIECEIWGGWDVMEKRLKIFDGAFRVIVEKIIKINDVFQEIRTQNSPKRKLINYSVEWKFKSHL